MRLARSFTGNITSVLLMGCAALSAVGCTSTSRLADTSDGRSGLPDGYYPMVGMDSDDPNHYPDGWPRYIVGEKDNMVMAYVPGGEFEAGEGPNRRRVLVDPFYIDVHEVTNSQFDRFRKAGGSKHRKRQTGDRPAIESNSYGQKYSYEYWPRFGSKQKMYPETAMNFWFWEGQAPSDLDFYLDYWVPGLNNDHPARAVSWWEALLYAMWAEKSLPTEAQWEFAARGANADHPFPWGSDAEGATLRCNSGQAGMDDGFDYAAPAMAFAGGMSPFGCYNMSGNVWEWCQNNWDGGIHLRPAGRPYVDPNPVSPDEGPYGMSDLTPNLEVNPVGPLHGDERVLRGGSFSSSLSECQVSSRRGARANVHQTNVGFRCVLPIPASAPQDSPSQSARAKVAGSSYRLASLKE